MDFKEQIPFGKTGLKVSRIGLASGYGVPTAAIEKAFHQYGINYFYVSPIFNLGNMVKALHNLALSHRDELLIVLARPFFGGFGGLRLEKFVKRWLKKLKLGWTDLLFQDVRKPLSQKLTDRIQRLRDNGKVRFLGISSHERSFIGKIASGTAQVSVDLFHVRYNAVHSGAEQDVFPHLPEENRPGIAIYTATCWRKLLKPKLMPEGECLLAAADSTDSFFPILT